MSEVSIRISARDNYSSAINTMRNSTRSFTNDAEKLQNKLDSLSRAKTTIKVDMQEAARNLRELKKEYTELKKAAAHLLMPLKMRQEELRRQVTDMKE